MESELPTSTREQQAFYQRVGAQMATLVADGMDLREAEREGARRVAAAMLVGGGDPEAVDALLEDALDRADIGLLFSRHDVPLSPNLQDKLLDTYKAAGGTRLSPIGLLVEKRATTKTGYPMILFSNESKHQGFPHVTVVLGDKKVNVSIEENPRVVAGNPGLLSIGAILAAVKKHHVALKGEWDASRPDDQNLAITEQRKKAAALAAKREAKKKH